jgi:hypothetical protein
LREGHPKAVAEAQLQMVKRRRYGGWLEGLLESGLFICFFRQDCYSPDKPSLPDLLTL